MWLQLPPHLIASAPVEMPRDPVHAPQPGRVTLRCHVTAQGAVERCVVVDETPAGAGLGDTALRAAAKLRMRPPAGDALRDGTVTIPMRFEVPAPSPAPNE